MPRKGNASTRETSAGDSDLALPSMPEPHEALYTTATASLPNIQNEELRDFITAQFTPRSSSDESQKSSKRVLFMGEHHEQPRVLAAQMVILDHLVKVAKIGGRESGTAEGSVDVGDSECNKGKAKTKTEHRRRPILLVMEQFNFLQQNMLDEFCEWPRNTVASCSKVSSTLGSDVPTETSVKHESMDVMSSSAADPADTSTDITDPVPPTLGSIKTEHPSDEEAATSLLHAYTTFPPTIAEHFNLPHYLPLLLYARSQQIRIVGGFPPRSWARIVAREGIDALKDQCGMDLAEAGFDDDRWKDLRVGKEHAAFVKSLVRGEAPTIEQETAPSGMGLVTAQAFKDAVLASIIDRELSSGHSHPKSSSNSIPEVPCTSSNSTTDTQMRHNGSLESDSSDLEPIILVITGSGHCEYGFGAPERLRSCSKDETCIVVCKSSDESTIWQGEKWGIEKSNERKDQENDHDTWHGDRRMADGVIVYDRV